MKTVSKKDITLFLMLLLVWAVVIFISPLVTYLATRNLETASTMLRMMCGMLWFPFLLFFLNFYVFWRFLFARRRYLLFVLVNLLLLVIINYGSFYAWIHPERFGFRMPRHAWLGMYSGWFVYFLLNVVIIAAAIAIRHWLTTRRIRQQLEEERHKNTEAELAWLKNQINPHFLFNTLNNISSLTQIDADRAQDAIAQLSDLLRYAMYETNKKTVPISGEVEFMRNYIELMKLRCNEQTSVDYQLSIANGQSEVAPLLFISLIENAFKHGVSTGRPSTINISFEQNDGRLTFICDNTNYPKSDKDRSGSGIGIENTRRRLELMYAGRYEWEQSLEDNIYHVKITLNPNVNANANDNLKLET